MTFLLDVNVLIALIDPAHLQHDRAHVWFDEIGRHAWATCPLTENGVLRIVGSAVYPNSPGAPSVVAQVVKALCALPGHTFWAANISLLDNSGVDTTRLLSSTQITDSYLLALAAAYQGQLATFDRRLIAIAVRHGAQHLHVID